MPACRKVVRHSRRRMNGDGILHLIRRRRMNGGSVWGWLKKAHNTVKNGKWISKVGNALGSVGVPYAGTIGTAAKTLGYGRRRRRVGRGLRLAGNGTVLAGARRR